MKTKIFLATLSGVVLMASPSCTDKLDIDQKGVVPYEAFYDNSDENAESAMTTAYADFSLNIAGNEGIYIPYTMAFNLCADNMYAAGEFYGDNDNFGSINEFRYDSQNDVIRIMYQRFYQAIYSCNLVIDNFTPDTDVKRRCVAEARVLRAWCHMMLALGWNDPPLVDHVLSAEEKPANYEGGHNGLLEWCVKECEEAAPSLRERESPDDKDGTAIVTKGLAYTVAGKARLFLGDYQGAKEDLKRVIDSGKYALVPGEKFNELFHIQGDGDSEKIFECNAVRNTNIGDWSMQIQRSPWMQDNVWGWRTSRMAGYPSTYFATQGWGGCGIEETFAKELYANEPNSYRRKATMLTFEEALTKLPYTSDKEGMTDEEKLADPNRGVNNTLGLYGQPEFLHFKGLATMDDFCGSWYSYKNYTIFRYAEVLLMYAECCARTGDNDGAQYLHDIQNRAGAPTTPFTLENVIREKNFELWCEGVRWTDMVRLGDFTSYRMKDPGNNIPSLVDDFFKEGSPYYNKKHVAEVTHSNPNKDAGKNTTFDKTKHIYFPYPYTVLQRNPNIKQNPGWGGASSDDSKE